MSCGNFAAFLLLLILYSSCVGALWPAPQEYHHGSSTVWLSPAVRLEYEPLHKPFQSIQRLLSAITFDIYPSKKAGTFEKAQIPTRMLLETAFERMKHTTIHQNIVPDKFHPRNTDYEPGKNDSDRHTVEVIIIKEVKNLKYSVLGNDRSSEAYSMSIADNGETIIQITSSLGGLNALQTFSQLFSAHSNPSFGHYCPFAPLSILDGPNFKHRGLNLDISRNWIPPTAVMQTIEALAATKLNKLHLHAADAQSWPLEIPSFPALADKAAYSDSQIWSVADLEAVQHHGLLHGVEVFLEIDLPGHTTAIGDAFPELMTAANEHQWSQFALQPPSGQLKLNSSEVTQFLSTLLNDLLPRQSRWTSNFHIGGDELNLNAYTLDPTVRSSSPKVLQPLVQAFVDHLISIVQSHGLEPIVWEEMALEWNLTLPSSVIVQTWLSTSALNAVLAKGHKVLFGSSSHWYLDCGFGYYVDPSLQNPNLSDPDRVIKPPYLDSCSPYKNWRQVYAYNPLKDVLEEHSHLIEGGEVHMWGELTDSVSLDTKLWPRVAAAAEVMWSQTDKIPNEDTTRRLAEFRERLVAKGIDSSMVQMEWCLRHEGRCAL